MAHNAEDLYKGRHAMETKNFPGDSGGPSSRPRFDDSITQLIRSAERFISQRKFSYAREQLGVARTIDPKNSYLDAILERIIVLERQAAGHTPVSVLHDRAGAPDTQRYLAVSVGPEFAAGIRDIEPVLTPAELQTRIRQLTTMAERYLERGSLDTAFDTLMKAYLLDPVSPFVLSCERNVLPAWQSLHAHPSPSPEGETVITIRTMAPPANQAEDQKRLEALRLRKDAERQEHERARWREASDPPKLLGMADTAGHRKEREIALTNEEDRNLFTKLKLGKFLNQ